MAERKKMSFEESCARLEEIVERLEDEKLSLEESVKLYEEGMKLIVKCNKELSDAERKIKILTRGEDGQLSETEITESALL